ncbi:MAG TPA: hypothetical protein VM165_10330, partial [Planctomycetaceae bacterium]|nr:hypothetical protein [Planctomycetaceae bacterium]
LGGLGINNDYIPALLPAMVVLSVWCLMYSVALAIKSEPLRHVTHRTFWFGMACVAIGLAILLGNGDITLQVQSPSQVSPGSENRWTSTNVVSWVLLGLGLLGLVPLCVPKQLLRSGQSPRHPVESWIFYYTSFVLFLGIPLTAVWWFGRENVSRFATYRGPELRYGDIKQTDELCQLLRKAMPGKDEQGVQILVTDLPLSVTQKADAAAPKAMRIELGFPESLADDKSETERIEAAIKALEQAQSKSQRAAFELGLGSAYPRRQPWDEMKTPLENINQQAGVPQSDARSWITWRYFSPLPRLCSALAAPLHAEKTAQSPPIYENDFREYMAAQQGARLAELELLDVVNPALFAVGSEPLLKFDFDGATATTERQTTFRIPASRLPGGARELLIHEALRLDPQRKDLVAEAVTPHERGELNRAVLEAAFPELIRPRSERRRSTLIDRDQWHRGLWAGLGLAVWLLGAAFISPNTTCLHDWYRDRLAATYLPFTAPRCDVPFPENGSTRLHNLQPHLRGGPFPLFVAASSLETPWRHARQLSAHFKPYIMTPLTCGSRELGVRPTNDDGGPLSELTTADAMAISAAALSPNYFVHHIFMALMALLNWRLGLWLPNPQGRKRLGRTPTLLQLLWDEWRTQWRHRRVVMRAIRNTRSADPEPLAEREFLLVTDGGHCENLGLEALLERRCDFIFVSDAGADPLHTFDDFARLRRRYEAETGVRFVECQDDQRSLQPLWELPCRGLSEESGRKIQELKKLADGLKTLSKAGQQDKPLSHDRPPRHFFVGKIIYPRTTDHPAAKEGWLVYIKPCLTGDENLIVQNFAANNDLFPHEPTTDQAFSYEQFEAYRVLGCHTGEDVALGIANRDGEFWKQQHSIESLKQHYGKTLPEQQLYVDAATADDVPAAKPAGSQRRQPAAKAPTGAGDEKIYYAELADQLS